jgi:hypothetical protein
VSRIIPKPRRIPQEILDTSAMKVPAHTGVVHRLAFKEHAVFNSSGMARRKGFRALAYSSLQRPSRNQRIHQPAIESFRRSL